MSRLSVNPIIVREMRSRMRGRRAFVVLTLYLMLLSCMAGSIYTLIYSENIGRNAYGLNTPNIEYGPVIGKSIFAGTVLLLLTIISFIAPAFTAGAIAGEREQKTYEILLVTPLTARQIVWGKLGAVFTFLLLLIVASLPIQSLAFLFGGVEPAEVIIAALGLLVTALAFGALGLFISTLARTNLVAIIITYGLGLPFIYGLPFILLYLSSTLLRGLTFLDDPAQPLALLLIYGLGFIASINPFGSAILTGLAAANGKGYFLFSQTFGPVTLWFVSPWLVYVIFYTFLIIILLLLTTRRVGRLNEQ